MSEARPRWYKVVIRRGQPSMMEHLAGTYARPALSFRTRCACCSVETPYAMEYGMTDLSFSSGPIRVPRCYECRDHLPTRIPNQSLPLLATLAFAGLVFFAVVSSPLFAIPAALGVAVTIALVHRIRRRRATLQSQGHFTGLRIAAGPNVMFVNTTNPTFANDVAAANTTG